MAARILNRPVHVRILEALGWTHVRPGVGRDWLGYMPDRGTFQLMPDVDEVVAMVAAEHAELLAFRKASREAGRHKPEAFGPRVGVGDE